MLFNESYISRNFILAKRILSLIDFSAINSVDKPEVIKLAHRMKFIPIWIYKIRDGI